MKKSYLSILSLALVLLMIVPLCVSCAETGEGGDTTPAATKPSGDTDPAEVTTADPFAGVNFGGETFTWYVWTQNIIEYDGEEGTGDMVESAVFKRNSIVQDKLGVKFEFVEEAGNSSKFKDFCSKLSASVNGGSHAYDALACYTRAASLLMVDGVLVNLLDTDHLNFENPWWPESLTQLNTIDGKLYFASGDIATSLLYQMMFVVLNNEVARDRSLEGVQKKALEGGWTLDYMLEICKDVYVDNDPVGTVDNTDTYGLVVPGHTLLDEFYIGSGMKYVVLDSEGNAVLSDDYNSDKSHDIIDKLKKLIWNDGDGSYQTSYGDSQKSGTSLLYLANGEMLQKNISPAGYDYSILTAPKYNAEQEKYYTPVGFPHSMYCIPSDINNAAMSGAVMEYMAQQSYLEVTPIVFDTAFKYRYTKSADDATMFDIIKSGVVFDLGRTFFDQMGGDSSAPVRMWRNEIANNTNTIASSYRAASKNWKKQLDSTIESIKAHQ